MQTVNRRVYLPEEKNIHEKMNHLDPELNAASQKNDDGIQEEFENLPYNQLLAQKSAELVAREWPFYSLYYDLMAHATKLNPLKISLNCTLRILPWWIKLVIEKLLILKNSSITIRSL